MDHSSRPAFQMWLTGLCLVVPLVFLLILAEISRRTVSAVHQTDTVASRLDDAKHLSMLLLQEVTNNETSQRGYVLTEDASFLRLYDRSLRRIPSIRGTLLGHLTERDVIERLRDLEAAIAEQLGFTAKAVALQKEGKHAESVQMITAGQSEALMERVREASATMESAIDEDVKKTIAEYVHLVVANAQTSWMIVGVDVLLGCALVMVFVRLYRSERLLHICAWSKTVHYNGEWITFEEYLLRQFKISVSHGISPPEAEKLLEELRVERGQREDGGKEVRE